MFPFENQRGREPAERAFLWGWGSTPSIQLRAQVTRCILHLNLKTIEGLPGTKKPEIDLKNLGPTNQQKKKTWKYTGRILGQQAWEIYWKYIGKALPHISFGI